MNSNDLINKNTEANDNLTMQEFHVMIFWVAVGLLVPAMAMLLIFNPLNFQ